MQNGIYQKELGGKVMFGYIIVNKAEMKFKEFDVYHSFYCGLCRKLKDNYGAAGQISLSYDMTFLLMLLTGLKIFANVLYIHLKSMK